MVALKGKAAMKIRMQNAMENLTDTRFRKLGKPKNSFRFATSAAET